MGKSARVRLYNSLVKQGWKKVKEDHPEGEVLQWTWSNSYLTEILFLVDCFEIYHIVRGELTFGIWCYYGRRQSQQLKRELVRVERDWRR